MYFQMQPLSGKQAGGTVTGGPSLWAPSLHSPAGFLGSPPTPNGKAGRGDWHGIPLSALEE